MRTSELKGGGDVTIPSQWLFFTDNCFLFTSMLVDTLCSMDVLYSPDSVTSYPRFPGHMPLARVLVCFLSGLRVSSYLYRYGLTTRMFTFRVYVCLLSD